MKVIAILLIISALTSAKEIQRNGRHVPMEENVIKEEYMFIVDDNGVMHWENLKRDVGDVEVNIADVSLYLYTNEYRNGEKLSVDNLEDLLNSQYYNSSHKNIFMAHGWRSTHTDRLNTNVREAIFDKDVAINAFSIDWHTPSDQFYTLAVFTIPIVGKIIAAYINEMMALYDLDGSDFILIGHSLGAHVVGSIGANVDNIEQIVGLDPAWPLFNVTDRDLRLDETDGRTVHIAHTSAGFQGFASSIGHADYYFNGGTRQPGCGPDISHSCGHGRAIDYYVESILTSGFRATQCSSYEEYESGACNENNEVYFGGYPVDDTIFGDYHLDTAESSPFALG